MVNNQGIMHAAHSRGGEPLCKNRNAHMSTSIDRFRCEPLQCKRCRAKLDKMDNISRRKADKAGHMFFYKFSILRTNPRLPYDIQSWIPTGAAADRTFYINRELTAWELQHYNLVLIEKPTPAPAKVTIDLDRDQLATVIDALQVKRVNISDDNRLIHISAIINMLRKAGE